MGWHNHQKDLRDDAVRQAKERHTPKQNAVEIPLDWLIASATKLSKNSTVLRIIVTDKTGKKVLIPQEDCLVYVEGYEQKNPTWGTEIGICEEFPPTLWPPE